jgi:RNA polymerase sigma factor (sigma-70 family)
MTEKTDAELVALARTGDKDAFGLLAQRYQLPMQRFAMRLAADTESPQDLVQEAMIQAYLSLPGLRNPARFKSWLYGIMLNVCRSRLRDRKIAFFSLEAIIEGLSFFPAPFSAPELTPEKLAEEKEQYYAVLNAVGSLPPPDRDILLLFYYAQLSLPEIVKMLNLPAGAVKVRLYRARQRLKSVLEEHYPAMIPPQKRRRTMVKVTIADVIKVEPKEGQEQPLDNYVIILYDEARRRVLPIWVGPFEGESIAIGLSDLAVPRPLTHRFFSSLLQGINARVEEVRVVALKINTFYGLVKIRCGKKTCEIDSRPSDAMTLAVLNDVPIFVAEEVLETTAISIPETVKGSPNRKGLEKITKELEERLRQIQARFNQPFKPPELSKEEQAKRDETIAAMFG